MAADVTPREFIDSITLYQDDELLVLNKPSGLLSVPGKGDLHDSLLTRLQQADPKALLVHRLDRDTSGLIVFARSPHAQTHLSKQFAARVPEKTYQALATGALTSGQGIINAPVRYNPLDPPKHIIDFDWSKAAVSLYASFPAQNFSAQIFTPVLLQPHTGRSHQLRVHMQHRGYPLLNDPLYSPGVMPELGQLALHAAALKLQHPVDLAPMMFYCNAPFNAALEKHGLLLPDAFTRAIFPDFPRALVPPV